VSGCFRIYCPDVAGISVRINRNTQLHGPFYYLTYKEDKKTKMIFLKKDEEKKAKELNDNYKLHRKNRAQISKINSMILSLLDEIEKINTLSLSAIKENG